MLVELHLIKICYSILQVHKEISKVSFLVGANNESSKRYTAARSRSNQSAGWCSLQLAVVFIESK